MKLGKVEGFPDKYERKIATHTGAEHISISMDKGFAEKKCVCAWLQLAKTERQHRHVVSYVPVGLNPLLLLWKLS